MSLVLDGSEKNRLLRRAHAVARVHHPNLARMLPLPGGAGLSPVTNGASRLAEFSDPDVAFRRIEPERLIWALLDVLSGLRALHEAELEGGAFVHGAITPQCILLGEPGSARLVPVTSAHLMPKVPWKPSGYVAPELLRGEPADLRADVFSVGVLLWEALAERRLFPNASRDAVLAGLDSGLVPRLGDLVKTSWALPLCRVAERAIAATPAARFGSALELSSAIVLAAGCRLTSPSEARPRPSRWRNITPPATVIDLPPAPGLGDLDSVTRLAPPSPSARPSELDWRDEIDSRPLRRAARVARCAGWVAAAMLGAGCLVFAAAKAPSARQPMAATIDAEPRSVAHFAAAPAAPSAAASTNAHAAAPAVSITPGTEPKQPAQKPASPRPPSSARTPKRPDSDYGI